MLFLETNNIVNNFVLCNAMKDMFPKPFRTILEHRWVDLMNQTKCIDADPNTTIIPIALMRHLLIVSGFELPFVCVHPPLVFVLVLHISLHESVEVFVLPFETIQVDKLVHVFGTLKFREDGPQNPMSWFMDRDQDQVVMQKRNR